MSGDALCVGVCMMDWEAGVCLGCGRTADEIHGPADALPSDDDAATAAPAEAPVPAGSAQAGEDGD
ncbi:MAG: DUF1289 domain-containing protein [Thauera sp.]|nr:DUF1289 domain-containing protein [Thauera sp.]